MSIKEKDLMCESCDYWIRDRNDLDIVQESGRCNNPKVEDILRRSLPTNEKFGCIYGSQVKVERWIG